MTKKTKRAFPHTYVIIFSVIIIAVIATWLVPAGEFQRVADPQTGRDLIIPGSYESVEATPQSWELFSAFYKGFIRSPSIIVFILILGGAFWILNESKAIDAGIHSFIRRSNKWEKNKIIKKIGVNNIIITSIMLIFSFFGAIFGMSEETIAFVIIFVPLSIKMGYDSIVGVSMTFIGAGLGFAGCLMNPFTLGIAQEIAGVPLFSGMGYRFIIWMVINIVGIGYVLYYANKIHKSPEKSPVYNEDDYWRQHAVNAEGIEIEKSAGRTYILFIVISFIFASLSFLIPNNEFGFGAISLTIPFMPIATILFILAGLFTIQKGIQYFVLNLLLFTILMLVAGVMGFGWGLLEIATLFFVMGLAAGIAMDKSPNEIVRLFIAGARDILSAALVVGLAGGIIVILEDGKIIDTLLYQISVSIEGFGQITTLSLMYTFQTMLNALITSGTAKAALIMPILTDISEMVNLSKQATVTAFHIGDGFTNLITPTSGVLIGVLEIARIPFGKWVKWAWPIILILVIIGWLLLIPTVTMNIPGY
ncbi:MAG: YfcC family protein [Bacteroidales bacterium]|jgi:uncharacterized ion transporter superfamily protein YfcC|nr:YfcC family protein [Bacteroidales bacterium]